MFPNPPPCPEQVLDKTYPTPPPSLGRTWTGYILPFLLPPRTGGLLPHEQTPVKTLPSLVLHTWSIKLSETLQKHFNSGSITAWRIYSTEKND